MAELQSLADAPGTLREYETIYILKPDTLNDRVAEVNKRVREIIESRGGKVLKIDNWGKRRLAYEVKKQLKGIYLYWQYLGSPGIVSEFERNMRMLDAVIRYMTIKVDADVNAEGRTSEADEEAYERAANTAADEEDLMFRRSDADQGEGEGEAETEGEGTAEAGAAETGAAETGAAETGAAETGAAEATGAESSEEASSEAADDKSEQKEEEE